MIYLISLIVLLLPSYLIRFSVLGIPTTLLEVMIYVAAIITFAKFSIFNFQFSNKSQFSIFKQKIIIPISLFIFAGIISVIISPDKREALGLFKAYILDPIILFWIIVINFQTKQKSETLIKYLILSGVIVAIHAIWQKLTGQVSVDGRVVGIFGYSPNYLAMYLVPIIVLLSGYEHYLINTKNYGIEKVWYWDLSFLLILLAIWLTGSRASLIALAIGILSFFIITYWQNLVRKKVVLLILSLTLIISAYFGWQILKPNWQATPNSGRVSSSNNVRFEIWQTTLRDILPKKGNWLLGVGLGNFQNYFTNSTRSKINYPEYISPYALTPHNLFLNIWLNLGLLGLISFIWLLILFFKSNKNSLTNNLLISMMIVIIIQGMVDSTYWKNDLAIIFWLILAIAFIQNNLIDKNEKSK